MTKSEGNKQVVNGNVKNLKNHLRVHLYLFLQNIKKKYVPKTTHCIYKGQEFGGTGMGESQSEEKMHVRHLILNRYSYKCIENSSVMHLDFTEKVM